MMLYQLSRKTDWIRYNHEGDDQDDDDDDDVEDVHQFLISVLNECHF